MPEEVVLLLGSNVDKEQNLPRALRALLDRQKILQVSSAYGTIAAGPEGQPPFLNAALLLETELDPRGLKQRIISPLESSLGRHRTGDRYAPRTIDLDIVLYGERIVDEADLVIPDPDLLTFPHVAVPVAELLPHRRHPVTGEALVRICQRLLQASQVEPPRIDPHTSHTLAELLARNLEKKI